MQKDDGTRPVKLLLLALSATRFLVFSHVVNGKDPVKKLLEMFSTCSGRPGVDNGSSSRPPPRRLKLTSRETMLLESISSNGRLPLRELPDRLRRSRPLRLPRDGDAVPSAAVHAAPPRCSEATILREPGKEQKQGTLLVLGT
ncbi:hypothetical protein PVAP13_9KG448385 [Panicum virgatum]|uniref:Uncharacterized protein n=1 Tax=Panicum virgatum TaxID=38727 RepID=A0A8T0NQY7_PANVG|nr:hypothetical protein PVAP13_9KG448385 [Panicum virgatum]